MPDIRLPAEWEPQDAVLLTWPHAYSDWLPYLAAVQCLYEQLIALLLPHTSVLLACPPEQIDEVQARLLGSQHLKVKGVQKAPSGCAIQFSGVHNQVDVSLTESVCWLYPAASNDTWARDHGPITIKNSQGRCELLNFQFNGWGNKFAFDLDDAISPTLHRMRAFGLSPMVSHPWVLEGGAIESDGQGTLLTTAQCLLNYNRNGDISKKQVEEKLYQTFGVDRVLWLNHGYLAGDDTDSHIDTLARFAPNNTIVYVTCSDSNDEHYEALKIMEAELQEFKTRQQQAYRLLPLPWPSAKFSSDGERLPATYANFLVTNGCVVVPTYQDKKDEEALQVVRDAFPDRKVIGLDCSVLIEQHGSLHCITMQLPKGVLTPNSLGG